MCQLGSYWAPICRRPWATEGTLRPCCRMVQSTCPSCDHHLHAEWKKQSAWVDVNILDCNLVFYAQRLPYPPPHWLENVSTWIILGPNLQKTLSNRGHFKALLQDGAKYLSKLWSSPTCWMEKTERLSGYIYTVYTYTYIHTCCAYISPHSSTAGVWVGPNIRIRIKCWRPWMMPSGGSRVHSKRFCTSCCEIFPLYKYLPWLEENHHSNGTQMVDFSLLSTAFRRVCVLGSISWQCCYQVRSAWHCGAWRGQSPKCWVFAKIITGNSGTNQHWRAK